MLNSPQILACSLPFNASTVICMQTFHGTASSGSDNFKALDIIENSTLKYYFLQKISQRLSCFNYSSQNNKQISGEKG